MKSTGFFGEIFDLYSRVKIRKELRDFYRVDTIVYYLADISGQLTTARNIWEIDIRSAFPTICKHLFAEEHEFLEELERLRDQKLERNIFISTRLRGTEYLKQLNLISKMIISSTLVDADPDAYVLELKKDGVAYVGRDVGSGKLFRRYAEMGFQIRRTPYQFYLRTQRTSHFLGEDGKLILKGVFRDRPDFLTEAAEKLLLGEEEVDLDRLSWIYSQRYWDVVRHNILDELFGRYYLCSGNKYLDRRFRYSPIRLLSAVGDLTPKNYLKLFLYPFLRRNIN